MIDRETLVRTLNTLCWLARRWGHDDYGLDHGVDIDGNPVDLDEDPDANVYHPEAIEYADKLLEMLQ